MRSGEPRAFDPTAGGCTLTLQEVVAALELAGCVAAEEEAAELVEVAATRRVAVDVLVGRRSTGEPLAWITGRTMFCGLQVRVDPGVYVPRWQSEPLARRAAGALSATGIAVDLCTGAGAIAAVLNAHRPRSSVFATDIDPVAVTCARANGVDALAGDLDAPLPADLRGKVDLITAVVPYVPTEELHLLPRDTLEFEPRAAIDGGPGGSLLLARVIDRSPEWLKTGGLLFLEIGGDQAEPAGAAMESDGFVVEDVLTDDEGDDRAILGRLRG